MVGSMIADVTDEHELRTGKRQEGLLFAASAFLIKASSGIGVLVAGIALDQAGISEGEAPSAAAIEGLALWEIGGGILFGAMMFRFFSRFDLDARRHAEIRAQLDARSG